MPKTDVGAFTIARLQETADEAHPTSRGRQFALTTLGAVEYLDSIGDELSVGDFAADFAYHPDYANWPAHDHAQHQNTPSSYPGDLA